MRSMLQLLGGVAVAGAVAAGTTAFTAGGLTLGTFTNPNVRDNSWLGGSQSVTVSGNATLNKLSFTQIAGSGPTDNNNVTLVTLTFAAGLPTDAVVTLTPAGGALVPGSVPADGFHCSSVDATTHVATCAVSDSSATAASAGASWSGLTGVGINVS